MQQVAGGSQDVTDQLVYMQAGPVGVWTQCTGPIYAGANILGA